MPDGLDQNKHFQATFLRRENFAFESFYFTELEKLAIVNVFIKNNSFFYVRSLLTFQDANLSGCVLGQDDKPR